MTHGKLWQVRPSLRLVWTLWQALLEKQETWWAGSSEESGNLSKNLGNLPGGLAWKFFLFYIKDFYFICMGVLTTCMSKYHLCSVPEEVRRGCQILQNWSYWLLWAATCVLGTEPGSSGRTPVLLTTEPSCQALLSLLKQVLAWWIAVADSELIILP